MYDARIRPVYDLGGCGVQLQWFVGYQVVSGYGRECFLPASDLLSDNVSLAATDHST